jgi:hypothetical protein
MAAGRPIHSVEYRRGNAKRSPHDQAWFFDIARGSTLQCAAIQDVLAAAGGSDAEPSSAMKRNLQRIVSMLTRPAMKTESVAESQAECVSDSDYEHEHRFAEHEHEGKPRLSDRGEGTGSIGQPFDPRHLTVVLR